MQYNVISVVLKLAHWLLLLNCEEAWPEFCMQILYSICVNCKLHVNSVWQCSLRGLSRFNEFYAPESFIVLAVLMSRGLDDNRNFSVLSERIQLAAVQYGNPKADSWSHTLVLGCISDSWNHLVSAFWGCGLHCIVWYLSIIFAILQLHHLRLVTWFILLPILFKLCFCR